MKLIERTEYLNQLINVQGTPDVKVITGIRRSGKSKLLEAFIDVVIENEPDSNVIHINYNDDEFEDLLEYHALLDYVKSKYVKEKNNYLFIDEVQLCDGFEKAINSFHASEKYYLCDHSFKYAKLGTKNPDYGRALENIVAIELMRRGYELYVGVLYKKEIDFVALRENEKLYIQVANSIEDEETKKRELDPLLKIKDAYPKMVITRTGYPEYDIDGIRIVDIANWLMQSNEDISV